MSDIVNLQPAEVWKFFDEILTIPRPSKKEEKIIEYLISFGEKHKLETHRDEAGNVLIRKPATKGMEKCESVVLQSHIDMVCEKNSDIVHDFNVDPIQAYVDGNWVKAKGTTLGADDGIGIAAQLAILASSSIKHGPIECLFTVDEETGLTGAFEMKPGFFNSKILLNLDSEDEGELFIGCAGGVDTVITFAYETEKIPSNFKAFKLSISGLKGGHSGDEIDKGLGNSIKIINRFLWRGTNKFDLRLANLDGGNLRNAIPREAFAVYVIHNDDVDSMLQSFEALKNEIKAELAPVETNLNIAIEETSLPEWIIDEPTQYDLLNSLYACPHGVIAMSKEIHGLVETSTNLASVKFIQDNQILVTTSQRSSIDSAKTDIANMVESVFRLANANVVHSDGYPGWAPNTNSQILSITRDSYKKLFGVEPIVRAIHAGLECGLFLEKYPYLDMISFGPTIKGAHSPDERIDVETTQKFWNLLLDVLEKIPANK
ncbi:MAG TPA: aminoacyl-histidine dipeptidase [Tenuifilaceae bacterium]|nr:aminoacyl-histidine dipeptidase [Tenuifilaceae bacterium]HPE17215.1 aminoacyl-histidine dipeptidase [Tenuifilaceae bacterium]HPJ44737.1 aminoacyl-histidine dipeptidase [Tenuifilaceae bacterium]HPQ33327.1 aminoacyl-histidine dipeptidase [Tenuifilaceae bacterium]HRX68654.1 aminoacyl-histidine dipeptidase [Tenuifilaceae bacterium]